MKQLLLIYAAIALLPGLNAQVQFGPYKQYSIFGPQSNVTALAIADYDQDGLKDVAVAASLGSFTADAFRLTLFRQNEQKILKFDENLTTPFSWNTRRSLVAGKLNADNFPDLVLPYGADSIAVYLNDQNGSFLPYFTLQAGMSPDCAAIGDLNNDGKNDIAISNWNSTFISIFYNLGNSQFNRKDYPAGQGGWNEIEIADMNNDGRNDVVLMLGQVEAGVYIYTQNNSGTLELSKSISMTNSNSPGSIQLGDINADGRLDILVSHNIQGALKVYGQNDAGNFDVLATYYINDSQTPVSLADLNCDGIMDLISLGEGQVNTFIQQGTSGDSFTTHGFPSYYVSHTAPQGLGVDDLNGDGLADIAAAGYEGGLVVLENTSPGSLNNPVIKKTFLGVSRQSKLDSSSTVSKKIITRESIADYIRYVYTDTFLIRSVLRWNEITDDSAFLREFKRCNGTTYDTTFKIGVNYEFAQHLFDTISIHSSLDTFWLSEPPLTKLPWSTALYPNPTSGKIQILFSRRIANTDYLKCMLVAEDGRVVADNGTRPSWISERILEFNLSPLPPGLYFLKVDYEDQTFFHRIVKTSNH